MRTITRVAGMFVAAALAGGCEDPGGSRAGPPAALEVVSGSGQQGTAGQPLPQDVVARVEDARGRPVRGQAVNFVVTGGGGSIFAVNVTTDDDGLAANQWTLGTAAGTAQTLEARLSTTGGPLVAVFTATAGAGAPASVSAGTRYFVGTPGAPLDDEQAVYVVDALGNPVAGVQVTWTAANGGSFTPATSTTNAQGTARSRWTLGNNNTAPQTATATVAGLAPVSFAAGVVNVLEKTSGDGLTVVAGTAIPVSVNALGPPYGLVPGARVRWAVASGGGSVTPPVSEVNGNGVAQATWTVGATPGQHTLTASIGGLSVTFTATVLPAGSRTLAAQVPGTVLDVSADRVLWYAGGTVRVRDRATGADQVAASALGSAPLQGHLFTGGAAFTTSVGGQGTLFEWRGGATATTAAGNVSFEGGWAAWTAGGDVYRRDLVNATTQALAPGTANDVGADGDVLFRNGAGLQWWSGAGYTAVPMPNGVPAGWQQAPGMTDGVKAVYSTFDQIGGGYSLWLVEGGQVERLTGANVYDPPTWPTYGLLVLLNGGWTAYVEITQRFPNGMAQTPLLQVLRRSPAGVETAATAQNTESMLEALGTEGSVVYRTQTRRFLAPIGGGTWDLGAATTGERVVYRGGLFYLIRGDGSVYLLGAS